MPAYTRQTFDTIIPIPMATVSASTEQLERKRANDRRSQRASRARTKERIQLLERELQKLRDIHPGTYGDDDSGYEDDAIRALARHNQQLQIELVQLRLATTAREVYMARVGDGAQTQTHMHTQTHTHTHTSTMQPVAMFPSSNPGGGQLSYMGPTGEPAASCNGFDGSACRPESRRGGQLPNFPPGIWLQTVQQSNLYNTSDGCLNAKGLSVVRTGQEKRPKCHKPSTLQGYTE